MNFQSEDIDHLFKIVLVGDSEVGKSQILLRYTKNSFDAESRTTLGVEFIAKKLQINDLSVKIQLWDTAGQEKFRAISKVYFRGAVGAVLVYDITCEKSFSNIQRWIQDIREWSDSPNIVIMLVGNKTDMEDDRKVSKQNALQFAENNQMGFIETSAKSGVNIEFAFKKLVEEILRQVNSTKQQQPNIFESEVQQQQALDSKQSKDNERQSKKIEITVKQSQEIKKKNSSCC